MTDTHYRCKKGEATLNYRLLFDIEAPRSECVLVLEAKDRDLLSKQKPVCEWRIDLKPVLEIVQLTQQNIHFNKQFRDLNKKNLGTGMHCTFIDENTFELHTEKEGRKMRIRLDLRILPKTVADTCPVGSARSEPNMDPFLYPPLGRI